MATDSEWITIPQAASLVGCSIETIRRARRDGSIVQRTLSRRYPSINRASTLMFAEQWQEQQKLKRKVNEEAVAAALKASRDLRPPPSSNGEVWLSVRTAAIVLRMSHTWVFKMVAAERIPAVRQGRRVWLDRTKVEQMRAARVFEATQSGRRNRQLPQTLHASPANQLR